MELIKHSGAQNVVLVHGEKVGDLPRAFPNALPRQFRKHGAPKLMAGPLLQSKMAFLKQKIEQEFGVSCYYPANGMIAMPCAVATATATPANGEL